MTAGATVSDQTSAARWDGAASSIAPLLLVLAGLAAVRILLLFLTRMNIQVDEAQYWDWSRHLAFGYFSKPPLIAWTIAAATSVCGSGEVCIRLPATLFYVATPLVIYAIGLALYDRKIAFWAAIGFAIAPGVSFSAEIISTDVLLLFLWSLALLAFVRLRAGGDLRWTVLLGLAFGLGLLAKYAMLYFVGCALVAALVDAKSRSTVLSVRFWLGVLIGLAILAPNLIWNAENGFITFVHTGDNISGGPRFRPFDAVEFFVSQFGVIGPFLFGGMLAASYAAWRKGAPDSDRMLLAFALPVVAVVTIAGLFNSANANWGAAAFVSTALVASAYLVRIGRFRLLETGIVIGVIAQLIIFIGGLFADRITLPFLKNGDIYTQVLGWRDLADHVRADAAMAGAMTVVATRRNEVATLNYYLRNDGVTVLAWPDDPKPDDHFEFTKSVVDHPPTGAALILSKCLNQSSLVPFFGDIRPLDPVTIASGPTSRRNYQLFRVDQIHLPLQTVELCHKRGRDNDGDHDQE